MCLFFIQPAIGVSVGEWWQMCIIHFTQCLSTFHFFHLTTLQLISFRTNIPIQGCSIMVQVAETCLRCPADVHGWGVFHDGLWRSGHLEWYPPQDSATRWTNVVSIWTVCELMSWLSIKMWQLSCGSLSYWLVHVCAATPNGITHTAKPPRSIPSTNLSLL